MANKMIPKVHIVASSLLDILVAQGISIRELGRRERIGYSERQLRWCIKQKRMSWDLIMKIAGELNLVFAAVKGKNDEPYVIFYDPDSSKLKTDIESDDMKKFTFWTPVVDPCGFEYPCKLTIPR